MSDDAQTLLSRATPRRANGDPIENEMTRVNSDVLLAAFDEIERLRALVEASIVLAQPGALTVNCVRGTVTCQEAERLRARVAALEAALRYYAEDNYNGYNATGACARAALEAKP